MSRSRSGERRLLQERGSHVLDLKHENNPYEPPDVQSVRSESRGKALRLRPLGPRMIPAVVCFVYGLLLLLVYILLWIGSIVGIARHYDTSGRPAPTSFQMLIAFSFGTSFLLAGWFWMRRKWLPAVLLTLAPIALGGLIRFLSLRTIP
jgi:hypothetical protein